VTLAFLGSKEDSVTLDVHMEINLFRVVQEALNNVLKHAEANHVRIELTASVSAVTLRIEDDGRGFDVKKEFARALTDRRMGLWSIEQRVSMLGGEVTIRSKPGHGTRIDVEVPYRGTSQ
jgi:signal transduction histidine kinase